jgi:hypothetical protein
MISRNLFRRLERREARLIPTDGPCVLEVVFVSPDGTQTPGLSFELPAVTGRAVRQIHRDQEIEAWVEALEAT